MHFTHIVAISGDTHPEKLRDAVEAAMAPYDENREVAPYSAKGSRWQETREAALAQAKAYRERNGKPLIDLTDEELLINWHGEYEYDDEGWPIVTTNPEGNWDWWVIGGRWGGAWVLKEGVESALATEGSAFGLSERAGEGRTDAARVNEVEAESIAVPFSYTDLNGKWVTKERWVEVSHPDPLHYGGRDWNYKPLEQDEWDVQFYAWLQSLPKDTWIVHVDYHS